jgi:hypothetical protein
VGGGPEYVLGGTLPSYFVEIRRET